LHLTRCPEERRKAVLGEVLGLLSSGKLVPNSGRSFPLSQFKEAIAHASKQGREDGKVILV
jgi:NADPH:quinone reductase-like Zn-dependent oxidoreductase